MREELLELIKDFKRSKRLAECDEAKTKQGVVLNILNRLGWDTFNTEEVCPEYSVGYSKIDFALRYNGENKVFIEVKKIYEDLEKYQERLLRYSFQDGVKLSILTNGVIWWFYLPLIKDDWDHKKFHTIDIYEQKSEDIATKFEELLSKSSVISGDYIVNAELIYQNKRKLHLIEKTLPKAWKEILIELDELLAELLVETTEKLCGYKPEYNTVEEFLLKVIAQCDILEHSMGLPKGKFEEHKKESATLNYKNYTGKSIVSFVFQGEEYRVNTWIALLTMICKIMWTRHKDEFNKIFSIRGRKRAYFSHESKTMKKPRKLPLTDANVDIYMETNLNTYSIVEITYQILKVFDYQVTDLIINTR